MDVGDMVQALRKAAEDGKPVVTAGELFHRLGWGSKEFQATLTAARRTGAVIRRRAYIGDNRVAVVALPEHRQHIGSAFAELRSRRYSPRRPAARSRQPGRVRSK